MAFSIQKLSAKSGVARSAPKRSALCAVAKSTGHWRPGSEWPAHLKNANLAGNHGFDPLSLGEDPQTLKWYVQSELVHARTAMVAVAGILIPSILTKAGILNVPDWFNAGKAYIQSPGAIPFNSLVISTILMTQFVELKRWEDFKVPGSQGEKGSFFGLEGALKGKENGYPGGPFDPLGLSSGTPSSVEDYKEKEIKNGRVAMVAFLGFACQYLATGKGPIDNLVDHINNPWNTTFASNGVSVPFF